MEINDNITCPERRKHILSAIASVPKTVANEYQETRKKFESNFLSRRQKILLGSDEDF